MTPSAYEHPLPSFHLLSPGAEPADDAFFVFPVPGGGLVVRRELRKMAARVTTQAVSQALRQALAHHQLQLAGFSGYGFDARWAGSVTHWGQVLREQEKQRIALTVTLKEHIFAHRGRVVRCRQLWGQLGLSARLSGLGGAITRGRAPAGEAALQAGLQQVLARARPHAELLAGSGFPAEKLQELAELLDRAPRSRRGIDDLRESVRATSAALLVLRGALLGELQRLSQAARQVLPREVSEQLQRQQLFGEV